MAQLSSLSFHQFLCLPVGNLIIKNKLVLQLTRITECYSSISSIISRNAFLSDSFCNLIWYFFKASLCFLLLHVIFELLVTFEVLSTNFAFPRIWFFFWRFVSAAVEDFYFGIIYPMAQVVFYTSIGGDFYGSLSFRWRFHLFMMSFLTRPLPNFNAILA